jgi:hypothetical protein
VERRIWKFSKGASTGEPSLAGFGGVVFQREAKAGKSWRQGGAMGRKRLKGLTLHVGGDIIGGK